jgi:hypothetical protein
MLSLILTGLSWWFAKEFGLIFLPIVGLPFFIFSATTTSFLQMKNKLLGNLLGLLGIAATIFAFLTTIAVIFSGSDDSEFNTAGGDGSNLKIAAVFAVIAPLVFLYGQYGQWRVYLKIKK